MTSAGSTSWVGLLAERAADLCEPYTRHLSGKVRESRFHLLASQPRVTYWPAPGRRVILLTVFCKTRGAEVGEVARALQAQKMCEAEHGPAHQAFDREVREKGEPRGATMSTPGGHASCDEVARQRRSSPEYREGYSEAGRAFRIGLAVRERRLALGLSQTELAARAKMTQPALSRLEADGVTPTIPLPERISATHDADLIAQISARGIA